MGGRKILARAIRAHILTAQKTQCRSVQEKPILRRLILVAPQVCFLARNLEAADVSLPAELRRRPERWTWHASPRRPGTTARPHCCSKGVPSMWNLTKSTISSSGRFAETASQVAKVAPHRITMARRLTIDPPWCLKIDSRKPLTSTLMGP